MVDKKGCSMKPLKIIPALKSYIWGGNKLKTEFNIKTDAETVAEAWSLSVHPDGNSVLENGIMLDEYLKQNPSYMGKNAEKFEKFPLLIKLIDACDNLSVQVHPDDSYALKNEGEYGKTEMWYVADCEKDAFLYYGFNRNVTKEEFEMAIENNTVTEILNRVNVKKGDLFFIPSGTVHAIGAGIVICEIQQNSNTTYRVYDYDRRDKEGNPRELHIKKALEVSDLSEMKNLGENLKTEAFDGYSKTYLGGCKYFAAEKLEIETEAVLEVNNKTFQCITVLEGECEISSVKAKKGESVFVPASPNNSKYSVLGKSTVILSYVPEE